MLYSYSTFIHSPPTPTIVRLIDFYYSNAWIDERKNFTLIAKFHSYAKSDLHVKRRYLESLEYHYVHSLDRSKDWTGILESSILPLPPTFPTSDRAYLPILAPPPQRVAPFVLDERSTRHRGAFHRGLFLLIISSSNDTRRDRKRIPCSRSSFNSFFDSPRAINRVRESLLELSGGDSSSTCQLRDDSVFLGTSDSKARGPIAIISPPLFKR